MIRGGLVYDEAQSTLTQAPEDFAGFLFWGLLSLFAYKVKLCIGLTGFGWWLQNYNMMFEPSWLLVIIPAFKKFEPQQEEFNMSELKFINHFKHKFAQGLENYFIKNKINLGVETEYRTSIGEVADWIDGPKVRSLAL